MEDIFKNIDGLEFFASQRDSHHKGLMPEALESERPENFENYSKERKTEFLMGRDCAERALKKLDGCKSYSVGVKKDRSPVWPPGVIGSITHNKNWVLSCVASNKRMKGLGVDIESTLRIKALKNIESKILVEEEKALGLSLKKEISPQDFLSLVFSSKEALFKCLYPICQTFFYFKDAEIIRIDTVGKEFTFRLKRDLGEIKKGALFKGHYKKIDNDLLTLVTT